MSYGIINHERFHEFQTTKFIFRYITVWHCIKILPAVFKL